MEKLKFKSMKPWDGNYDPMTLAQSKANSFNALQGDLTDYDCPKCKNRGAIMYVTADAGIKTQPCSCMKIRKCLRKMKESGLENIIREKTFDAFQATEPWQKELKSGAQNFARKHTGWFLMCGQSGCGKTHLCTAICRELLLAGDSVRYMPWRDEIRSLKAIVRDSDSQEAHLEELKSSQILYIDDLFKTGAGPDGNSSPSSADISLAFLILNFRYNNHLCTIISTEKSTQELQTLDEALAGRILEMARGNTFAIKKDPKKNWRINEAKGRHQNTLEEDLS